MVEKGKRKWVRIINIYVYVHIYTQFATLYLRVSMRLKKEVRQVNQNFFEFWNIGIAKMHKKYRRQDRDPR